LTNAAKHSAASLVQVEGRVVGGMLRIEVRDDGNGGADVQHGGGLAGLASRLAALEGRLRIASPIGGPTTVLAELPLPPDTVWAPPEAVAP
jgi:signal transduction histidine kinase